jgi:alkaline phosphatase D
MLRNSTPDMKDFDHKPLENMVAVGAVDAHSARLWMRTEHPGALTVSWWPENDVHTVSQGDICIPKDNNRDNTCSIRVPDDFPPAVALTPLHAYGFRIIHRDSGVCVGKGRFETAPSRLEDTPERFALALMSCHQPFDANGVLAGQSEEMLRATYRCLEAHNTKLVFTVGDQMYADQPEALSLFNESYFATLAPSGRRCIQECTAAEVRRLYQRRYRSFWSMSAWQALHADFPCYPILDDHEIVDNWGTRSDHRTPEWQALGEGARAAYMDYQGSRIVPWAGTLADTLHYTVSYGNLGVFVMDLRSGRTAWDGGQLFSQDQEVALRRFLHEQRDTPCLCIVLSVPVIHLPERPVRLLSPLAHWHEDFADRWSTGAHRRDRDRLLHWLADHQRQYPTQRMVLLSGDIHIGCVHEVQWGPQGPLLYQMISSGITNDIGALMQRLSTCLIRLNRYVSTDDGRLRAKVKLLRGEDGERQNPYGGLNVGILEIITPKPETPPTLRFYLYSHRGEEPMCVYRSRLV